jgi:P-type Cu2+ transporter
VTAHTLPFDALAALDDPQEWSAFSRPAPAQATGACWESNLLIEGMHCAACSITVEDALRALPGVVSAEVSAASHRAKVVWQAASVAPSALMQAVQRAGYRAVPANDVFARERRLAQTRQALWRWLVAGLCMMQVMMYAYPAYVALPGDLSPEMAQLLRWASWVLTLPVIVFSCGPFFSQALRDVAARRISMDLPVAVGMAITFVVSTAGTFDAQGVFGREVYFDSLTMFVFFLLTGRWLELRLRDRTAGALEAVMNRLPDTVERRTLQPNSEARFERVAVRRLLPGDEIRVLAGEAFPADGTVLHGVALADEALLTGESTPVTRQVGEAVVAGSHNVGGAVHVRVQRTGANTRFGDIVALMQSASTSKPPLALLADRIAKPFLLAVLLCSAAACAFWWPHDPAHALMVAVSVLIVTCPCALSLATPAAMLATAGALAQRGILVRRLPALEALGSVNTVVFDKTGTLTSDRLQLGPVHTRPGVAPAQALAVAAALARQSRHPVSRAIVLAAEAAGLSAACEAEAVTELAGHGLTGRVVMHAGSLNMGELRLGSAAHCNIVPPAAAGAKAGAASTVYLSDAQGGWMATLALAEQLRADAQATVQALQAAGLRVCLLSGDGDQAVQRVALALGIDRDNAKGGCTPQDKLRHLRTLQQHGARVAMVGDGLNDGPVLAGAHASFAFGKAVPIAQAQADFVVLGESLAQIGQTLRQARKTVAVVHQNLIWAVVYNAACVPLAVMGLLPAWLAGLGMAASSLLVVLNALRLARPA